MEDYTVLVLEDEPFQRLVTVTALEKFLPGHILQAADGHEAVALLSSCDIIDIVLCDLKMVGMDGLEFLRHVSSSGKVRAVVLCSELDPLLRQATIAMINCLGLTFLGDLGKPFMLEDFCQVFKTYQELCNAPPERLSSDELPTLSDVLEGLGNGEFEAYYQPKVTLQGQVMVGAEVLARWKHPQWGVLTPAHFLPVMEEHNLIGRLFWQLFEQGLALQQRLKLEGGEIPLAFNLHPSQLACPSLTERIPLMLKRAQIPTTKIMFEITESSLISAPATSLENLVRLRMLGCGLAMDDFGAGYSSLDRLSELPFTEVKLDRVFVRKMQGQPKCAAIISCAVALARALDISLVIEGVETTEQQVRLIELGGIFAQGFLFARPMPKSHFLAFCAQQAVRD
ncbi:EAL domain-containing response regulator [Pseudomonas sp. Je.1.5.c]|uniref:EAL domain-containing response regulator n=1 Tax=Pseudomonas sp. Je.1.5.c TaxID=3142839 RepID=UPI003DA8D264